MAECENMNKCVADTGQLNCGCCDSVRLTCILDEHEDDTHLCKIEPRGGDVWIKWSYAHQIKPAPTE